MKELFLQNKNAFKRNFSSCHIKDNTITQISSLGGNYNILSNDNHILIGDWESDFRAGDAISISRECFTEELLYVTNEILRREK